VAGDRSPFPEQLEQEGLHGAPPMGDPGSMAGAQPPEQGTAQ
jgi:hypothetical protein